MRKLWPYLALSFVLHLILAPKFLSGLVAGTPPSESLSAPERMVVHLVERSRPKPPPKPKAKPKVETKPKVEIKPKPKVKPKVEAVRPAPSEAPPQPPQKAQAVKPPVASEPAQPSYPQARRTEASPASKPSLGEPSRVPRAKSAAKPSSKPADTTQSKPQPMTSTSKTNRASGTFAVPESEQGGRPGAGKGSEWSLSDGGGESVDSGGQADGVVSGGPESGGGDVQVVPEAPPPAAPPPPPPPPPPPAPPKPKTSAPAQRSPQPVAAREATISVPTIDPPAKFRREKLKGQLWVRFRIEASGEFTVSLFDSSGNPEFDQFVLDEVKRTAVVEPSVGSDGRAERSNVRRPVEITID